MDVGFRAAVYVYVEKLHVKQIPLALRSAQDLSS